MRDRLRRRQREWALFFLCIAAALYGLLLIFSATRYSQDLHSLAGKQAVALAAGVVLCLLLSFLDLRALLARVWWLLPGLNAGLLLLLIPLGNDNGTGNKSWISLPGGIFNFQPGEIVKLSFLLLLALQLKRQKEKGLDRPRSILLLAGHALGLCALLYGVSGDIGMVVVYLAIYLIMLWSAGVHPLWLAGQVAAGAGESSSCGPGCRTISVCAFWWFLTTNWTPWARDSNRSAVYWPLVPDRSPARVFYRGPRPKARLPRPCRPGTRILFSLWQGRSWGCWAAWLCWQFWGLSSCGACG